MIETMNANCRIVGRSFKRVVDIDQYLTQATEEDDSTREAGSDSPLIKQMTKKNTKREHQDRTTTWA